MSTYYQSLPQYLQQPHQQASVQYAGQPYYVSPAAGQQQYMAAPPYYAATGQQQFVPAPQQYMDPSDPMCTSPDGLGSWFNFTDGHYLRGLAIGAAAALVLTNPTVQQALVKGAVTLWSALQGSIEELKEQVEDVKAEMSQQDG